MKINEIVLYFLGRASAYPATALALFLGGVYLLYAELRTVRKRDIAQVTMIVCDVPLLIYRRYLYLYIGGYRWLFG